MAAETEKVLQNTTSEAVVNFIEITLSPQLQKEKDPLT